MTEEQIKNLQDICRLSSYSTVLDCLIRMYTPEDKKRMAEYFHCPNVETSIAECLMRG
jgi:hypothetical protein